MPAKNQENKIESEICFSQSIFTIPNMMSIFRIILIAPCVYFLLNDNYIFAAITLIFSGLSDMFDGIVARKFNQETKIGQIIDPVADKLTLAAVIFCFSLKFKDIIPIAIVLIIKEFVMLVAGIDLINKKIPPPPAKWYGKLATIFFYFSVIVIVGLRAFWGFSNQWLTCLLLGITAYLMLYALIRYFLVYVRLFRTWKEGK